MIQFFLVALTISSAALADAGYIPIHNSSLPAAVRATKESVFRIVPRLTKPREYREDLFESLLKSADAFSKKQLNLARLASKSGNYISVNFDNYGTAFLLGDDQNLICSRHTWDSVFWTVWLAELDQIEDQEEQLLELVKRVLESRLEFDLFDSEEKLVFSTSNTDRGTLKFILNYRYFEELQNKAFSASPDKQKLNDNAFDFVAIKLSRGLKRRPLQLYSGSPPRDAELYAIGFPSNFDNNYHRRTNSSGVGVWVSKGKEATAISGARALGLGGVTEAEAESIFNKRLLFLTNESSPGISGGPVVDALGRVVSLVAAGHWDGRPMDGKPITSVPSPSLFQVGVTQFSRLFELE